MFRKMNLLVLVMVLFSFAANAQSRTEVTKFDAWQFGANLSMAAIYNALNDSKVNVDKAFLKAAQNAEKFGVKLPALPAKTTDKTEYTRLFIEYFVNEAGHPIQKYLKENFSKEHAAAFDLGVATNIYLFLQIYGGAAQAEIYSPLFLIMIEDRTNVARLPVQTTEELVKLNGKNPTVEMVKTAVLNTMTNVAQYLMKRDALKIGDNLADQEKYDEAINQYTKLINYDPNFADVYFNRGVANYYLKKYDSAIADFTKFIGFADKNSYVAQNLQYAYVNRCVNYYYKKDFVRAESDCTMVINLNKNTASPYYFRAKSRWAQEKIVEAIDDFTKVIELNPNTALTYYYRGVAYQKIGKEDLAKQDFEKAESLEPGIIQKLMAKKEND